MNILVFIGNADNLVTVGKEAHTHGGDVCNHGGVPHAYRHRLTQPSTQVLHKKVREKNYLG